MLIGTNSRKVFSYAKGEISHKIGEKDEYSRIKEKSKNLKLHQNTVLLINFLFSIRLLSL